MGIGNLVCVGAYPEPILFGTGEVLLGQGKGIHTFRLDPQAGTLTPLHIKEGVRNPSYLCFNRARTHLWRNRSPTARFHRADRPRTGARLRRDSGPRLE